MLSSVSSLMALRMLSELHVRSIGWYGRWRIRCDVTSSTHEPPQKFTLISEGTNSLYWYDNTAASLTKYLVDNRWKHGVKLLHNWKNVSQRCEFFGFYLYLCHVLLRFMLVLNCNTKISEKSDMAKSWALGFAACHKQELFVAQELINKVKSKCCGIKGYLFFFAPEFNKS